MLPKDPKTATDTAAPPPKKPPVYKVADYPHTPSFFELKQKNPPSDQDLLNRFKADGISFIRELNLPQNQRERVRLVRLIDRYAPIDPDLNREWENVKAQIPNLREKSLTLSRKTQTKPAQEIPTVTAEKLAAKSAEPKVRNEIGSENAKGIEKWMNNLKPGFYRWLAEKQKSVPPYLAEKQFDAASSANYFSHSFLEYLSMYKGGLAGFYLSQGAHEMIYSALGPIGEALSGLHQKDLKWKMAWMKNPLNPNALHYWLSVMPEEHAFSVALLPVKAVFAILAHGGGPFTKATYQEWDRRSRHYGQIRERYFFTPTLRLGQAAHIAADGLDKLSGISFDKARFRSLTEKTNYEFGEILQQIKNAKTSGRKKEIWAMNKKLNILLDEHDGFYRYFSGPGITNKRISKLGFGDRAGFGIENVFRAVTKNLFRNAARRLRNTHTDPISYLLSLIGGLIWDLSAGLALNVLRVAATRVINAIPGLNTLRAQAIEFFSSNRYLTTARIGGATTQNFIKGALSPTAFSSGYLGAGAGGWVANALGLPVLPGQIIGGVGGWGLGTFYSTSLRITNNSLYFDRAGTGWVQKYDSLLSRATNPGLSISEQNFYRGELEKNFLNIDSRFANFRPGPFSRFANWLYQHPYARLPVNGIVIADLGVKLLGWNPVVAYPTAIVGDYLWQVRGPLMEAFGKWFFKTPIGQWSLRTVGSINRWIFYRPTPGALSFVGQGPIQMSLRPGWQFAQNTWSKIQPYAKNFFNPGFFMGFNFVPFLTPTLGPWAYIAGPILGSTAWLGVSRIIQSAIGAGPGFLSSFSAWGWSGYLIGSVLDLLIPGSQAWLAPSLGIGFPIIGSVLTMFNLSFMGLVEGALATLAQGTSILAGLASSTLSGLGLIGFLGPIMAVAGLALFFGFTIYSAMWVPTQEYLNAGSTSNYFNIKSDVNEISPGKYQLCSNFNVTSPLFNLNNYLEHEFNFTNTLMTVDLSNPAITTRASRNAINLNFNWNYLSLGTTDYSVILPNAEPFIVGGWLNMSKLKSYLSTPYNESGELFSLIKNNPESANIVTQFLEVLQQLAEDKKNNTNYYLDELQASLDLLSGARKDLRRLLPLIKSAAEADDINTIIAKLNNIQTKLDDFSGNPPIDPPSINNCTPEDNRCLKHQDAMQKIYDSWPQFFSSYSSQITSLLAQAQQPNPDLAAIQASLNSLYAKLETQVADLEKQEESLKQVSDQLNQIGLSSEAVEFLTDPAFDINHWTSLSPEKMADLEKILKNHLPKIFTNTKYFYIPQGTRYQVCVDAEYCKAENYDLMPAACAEPPQPQTVCSTIMAMQGSSSFGTSTGFATQCTTFTPSAPAPSPTI